MVEAGNDGPGPVACDVARRGAVRAAGLTGRVDDGVRPAACRWRGASTVTSGSRVSAAALRSGLETCCASAEVMAEQPATISPAKDTELQNSRTLISLPIADADRGQSPRPLTLMMTGRELAELAHDVML
ncbi:hypothetical protein SSBR45G_10460 [Bradyrhizobium sp. SSBR45G]|nr:hypothetical protein SSBR45G_10460 [Bradyrhizobium sp. SSBR45G]GLH83378.1 hypothetical protein SSBR45R_08380 [Bradyrhizobium sp. SSBR45R]